MNHPSARVLKDARILDIAAEAFGALAVRPDAQRVEEARLQLRLAARALLDVEVQLDLLEADLEDDVELEEALPALRRAS